MTRPPRADGSPEAEPPHVPGFATWRGVYLFVFGWLVVLIILLAWFTRFFS